MGAGERVGARLTVCLLLLAACNQQVATERPVGNPAHIGLKMTDAKMKDSGTRVEITMRLELLGVPSRVQRLRLYVFSVDRDRGYLVDRASGHSGYLTVEPNAQAVDIPVDANRTTPDAPPPATVQLVAMLFDAQYGQELTQNFDLQFPWAGGPLPGERSPRSGG